MKPRCHILLAASLLACAGICQAAPASPYAGQETREIKAMSAEDVSSYLAGKGMGLAKSAELNGYPGPSHVLELAEQLKLSAEQRARTQALFNTMQAKAIDAGRALIDAEQKLDRLFAGKAINPDLLEASLKEIGALQARVRGVHLEAHLLQVGILDAQQVARYNALRGYDKAKAEGAAQHGHRHKH
ncbi:periplasmic heavy metal sensor [Noviherbaspirillum aerium]|uniref:periplasmic heavy metal sensor n=1 Tax=Noviherbaspirillum aerium TaxID=2588497 RepID=UPI00124C00C4|nr:periplasmic heavy metal sensor [Noviherbaspirillum aerium]